MERLRREMTPARQYAVRLPLLCARLVENKQGFHVASCFHVQVQNSDSPTTETALRQEQRYEWDNFFAASIVVN